MKIKITTASLIILLVLFGGIIIADAAGIWQTSGAKEPEKFKEGSFVGEYDPSGIKGSYTFAQISSLFNIPIQDILYSFGLQNISGAADFHCSELEAIYEDAKNQGTEIGTSSVKLFTAYYLGLPFEPETDTYILIQTYETLKSRSVEMIEERLLSLKHFILYLPEPENYISDHITEASIEGFSFKGSTTFNDLSQYGLDIDRIETLLGLDIPNPNQKIKDFCDINNLNFGKVKELLQAEIIP